jgi:hypothetical protein
MIEEDNDFDIIDVAQVIVQLGRVMLQLSASVEHNEEGMRRKMADAVDLERRGNHRLALQCVASHRLYKTHLEQCAQMRETVERVREELLHHQNNLSVFRAYSLANERMEAISKDINLDRLQARASAIGPKNLSLIYFFSQNMLDSLSERFAEQAEVSQALAQPLEDGESSRDPDELESELREFLGADFFSGSKNISKTQGSDANTSLKNPVHHAHNNTDKTTILNE